MEKDSMSIHKETLLLKLEGDLYKAFKFSHKVSLLFKLEGDFTKEELHATLNSMHNGKSLRIYDFSSKIFQKV